MTGRDVAARKGRSDTAVTTAKSPSRRPRIIALPLAAALKALALAWLMAPAGAGEVRTPIKTPMASPAEDLGKVARPGPTEKPVLQVEITAPERPLQRAPDARQAVQVPKWLEREIGDLRNRVREGEARIAELRAGAEGEGREKAYASTKDGEEGVELLSLEREVAAQRELLESYLARHRDAVARRQLEPSPEARVHAGATAPAEDYLPTLTPLLAVVAAGLVLFVLVVMLMRHRLSRRAKAAPPAQTRGRAVPSDSDDGTEHVASPAPVPERRLPGQWTVEDAAERLIAGGASRAIFVSPEGNEAAAAAVLVAREVADAGFRVLLLDLTPSAAASRPMLESSLLPGITNLLAAEAQFTDVIRGDHYSTCDVIPFGTADQVRAMRAVERLPIILESLTTAYDVVVVECGPAGADHIRRLVSGDTEILVSVIEPGDTVIADTATDLMAGGYEDVMMMTPAGHAPSGSPMPGRSAALTATCGNSGASPSI